MVSKPVPGGYLGTSWDDAPIVRFNNRSGGNGSDVLIEYVSEAGGVRRTLLTFSDVYRFDWIDEYIDDYVGDDFGFALIEILDSSVVRDLVSTGRRRDWLEKVELRHYRIGFDDHGTYDVVCLGLTVEVAEL